MTRVHGWIVLDKARGMSSAAAVAKVKRATGAAKAGHAGTLDPLATGVLPIALGEATKTVAYAMSAEKEYAFTVRWGEARDTGDAEGAVTATSDVRPHDAAVRAILPRFTGTILQSPPAFSAVKIGGRRAYDLARKGEAPVLAPREVQIHRLELIQTGADEASFHVACGKGTYIRSLGTDLAHALGTEAHVTALRRTRVGRFTAETAIPLENLSNFGDSAPHNHPHLLAVETVLDDIPALALNADEAERLRHGQSVEVRRAGDQDLVGRLVEGAVICAFSGGKAVALATIAGGHLRPVRVLNH